MANLNLTNVKLINTYLRLVPTAYKLGERRLVFDKIEGMTNDELTKFLRNKIGVVDTIDKPVRVRQLF